MNERKVVGWVAASLLGVGLATEAQSQSPQVPPKSPPMALAPTMSMPPATPPVSPKTMPQMPAKTMPAAQK